MPCQAKPFITEIFDIFIYIGDLEKDIDDIYW